MSTTATAFEPVVPLGLTLRVASLPLGDRQFAELCRDNPDLRLELTADRELIIMSPTGSKTGWRNSKLNQRLANWAERDGTGITFDSSTGFTFPNGAKRSPDASWVRLERWQALSPAEQEAFAPLSPDLVIELRSPQDELGSLRAKMTEYVANGVRLGMLIDTLEGKVHVYRPGAEPETVERPRRLRGDPEVPSLELDLVDIL
ncbi:MAG TPA: Uma2 family endonuclease [Thermoanaerobaculia bacterium]|nr:Uma2 family endonuclease [Thermoanaerobaculia bacterium]